MRALVVVIAAGLALGCSSSSDKSSESNPLCIPGAQVACACPGGAPGAQACLATAQGYGECLCPDAAAPEPDAEGQDAVSATDGPTVNDVQSLGDGSPSDSPDEAAVTDGADDSSPTDAGPDALLWNEVPNTSTDACTFPGTGRCNAGLTFVSCESFGYPFADCVWIPGVAYQAQEWCCPENCVKTTAIIGCPSERPVAYKCDSSTTEHHVRVGCEPHPLKPEALCCPSSSDGT